MGRPTNATSEWRNATSGRARGTTSLVGMRMARCTSALDAAGSALCTFAKDMHGLLDRVDAGDPRAPEQLKAAAEKGCALLAA